MMRNRLGWILAAVVVSWACNDRNDLQKNRRLQKEAELAHEHAEDIARQAMTEAGEAGANLCRGCRARVATPRSRIPRSGARAMTVRDIDTGEPHDEPLAEGRKVIAVVGINRYRRWPTLDNAVRDATGALDALHRLGFESICPPLLDDMATGEALRRLVSDDLSALSRDDSLVLFFAGHGHTQTRELYSGSVKTGFIVPVDGDAPGAGTSSWLRIDSWLSDIARLAVRHVLVILDACHSGIALGSLIKWRDSGRSAGPLDSLRRKQSRRVITSALEDQRAMDSGPLPGHSLFAGCLIEALSGGLAQGGRTEVASSDIGAYVRERVTSFPGSQQTPDFGALEFDQRGDLVIPLGLPPTSPDARTRRHTSTSSLRADATAATVLPTFAGQTAREWERDLRSMDPAARREAAWGLGQMGSAAAVALPTILELMHATEPSFELVDAIGRIAPRDERALLPLTRALGAPEERTRARAAELLAGHETRALDLLLRSIEHPQRVVAACLALAWIGEPAIAPLLDLAASSPRQDLLTSIYTCIGVMSPSAHDEVVSLARARAQWIPPALEALDRTAIVRPSMVDFALKTWWLHLSPRCDELATKIALRGDGDAEALLPLAAAALGGRDRNLVPSRTRPTRAPATRRSGF
jgi:Caspase domain